MSRFRRRQMLAAAVVPGGGGDGINIPTVFQRVEYIDTDGNQYINTGVNTSPDFSAELDLLFLQTPAATTWAMSASNSYGHAWGQYDGVFAIKSYAFTQSSASVRSKVEYYVDGGSAYIKIGSDSCSFSYSDGTSEWVLFGKNGWGNGGSVRLWECKFYESGVLVRHLIPCYRKSDHKPGLWDMVTWSFYTNANTSALTDFTVGPDVIQPATQYIIFVDRAVEAICAQNWGDGIGITPAQAAVVTNGQLGGTFQGNTQIVSFDEFQYFTGVTTLTGNTFYQCSNLASVKIPNSLTQFEVYAFTQSAIRSLVFDSVTQCNGPYYAQSLTYVEFSDTLVSVGNSFLCSCNSLATVVLRSTTPPSGAIGNALSGLPVGCKIYVPYSADHSILNAYKAKDNFANYASQIYELNPDGTIPS